jgi:two-component system, OmpR family, response regulator
VPNKSTQQEKRSLLIVEDQPDICLLLNIMLTGKNVEIDQVKRLSEAKEYLLSNTPDVILMDNKLPDGMGMDLIPFIRSTYPGVKIIMISGFHPAEIKDIALENGADIFLEKPFTKQQVFDAVQQLLNAPQEIA